MKTYNNSILFFVKYPEPGKVKTRLAKKLGDKKASALYRCFIQDLLETFKNVKADIHLYYTPGNSLQKFKDWLGNDHNYVKQPDDTLGGRMSESFDQTFSINYQKAIVIGSDSPDLGAEMINNAFNLLDNNQAVIGPAADGGYYLLGFNRKDFLTDIFKNINWSTDKVFSDTMKIFKNNKYKVAKLSKWHDIDTFEDLKKLYKRNLNKQFSKSTTFLFIREKIDII